MFDSSRVCAICFECALSLSVALGLLSICVLKDTHEIQQEKEEEEEKTNSTPHNRIRTLTLGKRQRHPSEHIRTRTRHTRTNVRREDMQELGRSQI